MRILAQQEDKPLDWYALLWIEKTQNNPPFCKITRLWGEDVVEICTEEVKVYIHY